MLRIVPLLFVLSCGDPIETGCDDALARWLEDWSELRECMVSPLGDSIADGVAVAMLQGADCRAPLAQFTANFPLDEMSTMRWSERVRSFTDSSPYTRAEAIVSADLEIAIARLGLGLLPTVHPRKELLTLSEGHRPSFKGTPIRPSKHVTFNGGVIRDPRDGFVLFTTGSSYAWRHSTSESLASHLTPVPGAGTVLAAHAVWKRRVVVRRATGSAYELWVSLDEGRTWKRRAAPEGILLSVHDSLIPGHVDLLVRDGDLMSRHRVKLSNLDLEIVQLGKAWSLPELACSESGDAWYLRRRGVIHIAAREILADSLDVDGGDRSIDCRRDRAIVLRRSPDMPDVMERCGSGCYEVFRSTSTVRGVAALAADQTWIYAASNAGVVSIRREGESEQLWRLPTKADVVAISVLEGHPYLVIDEGTSYRVIPLP